MPSAALAAITLLATAGLAGAATPGVTSTQISIGSSGPLTGDAAATGSLLRGADAYFKYVNAHGGINGRAIKFTYLDDADDSSRTLQNTKQLVEQNHVFAMFSVVGTSANLAIRDYLNAARVPQVFAASSAVTFGRDYATYPWTIGYAPTYALEGQLYGRNILANGPAKPKIAILYEGDVDGRNLLSGFRAGLGAQARKLIVETIGYDPTSTDIQAQVAQLKNSGANVFCVFAFGKFAIQAFVYADKLAWHPQIYLDQISSATSVMRLDPQDTADGTVSALWAKDPVSPPYKGDPGIKLATSIIRKYVPGGSTTDAGLVTGMAEAYSLVDALRAAGKNLTRQGLMRAVTHLDEPANPFLAPGTVVRTSPTSRFPVSQMLLQRWQGAHWVPFGQLLPANP